MLHEGCFNFVEIAAAVPAACPVSIQLPCILVAECAMWSQDIHLPHTKRLSNFLEHNDENGIS